MQKCLSLSLSTLRQLGGLPSAFYHVLHTLPRKKLCQAHCCFTLLTSSFRSPSHSAECRSCRSRMLPPFSSMSGVYVDRRVAFTTAMEVCSLLKLMLLPLFHRLSEPELSGTPPDAVPVPGPRHPSVPLPLPHCSFQV